MDPTAFLLFSVFVAYSVEAALGFGSTIILVALGSLVFPIKDILPPFIPVSFLLNTYLVGKYRKNIDLNLLFKTILPWMLLGMPLGLWGITYLKETWVKLFFGCFICMLSFPMFFVSTNRSPVSPIKKNILLWVGGVIHGAFGTGGPNVVYVLGRSVSDKNVFRSTLSLLWALLGIPMVITYVFQGQYDARMINQAFGFIPMLFMGILVGETINKIIPAHVFNRTVFMALILIGLFLMVKNGSHIFLDFQSRNQR